MEESKGSYQLPQLASDAPPDASTAKWTVSEGSVHPLSVLLSFIWPCQWCCAPYTVQEQEEAIVLQWGKFYAHRTTPGLWCDNPYGRSIITVSTRQVSIDLKDLKVVDSRGNPLLISGVVRYFFRETLRTALEVENAHKYVEDQATAVLKQVVARFPYEALDGGPCLKTESAEISAELVNMLQDRVMAAGARIVSLSLSNIAYAPEVCGVVVCGLVFTVSRQISAAMLKRQQAFALVEARQAIVQGAVDIAIEATDELNTKGHPVDAHTKAKIVRNLLTILCSESMVVPTLRMN